MDITLEWEGIAGVIKVLLIFLIPLAIGFVIGRKTKEKTNQPLFYIYDDGTVEKRIVLE